MENLETQEYLLQSKTLMGQEKYEQALTFLQKAEQADRMNIEVYLSKGICYANMDLIEQAKGEFEKALKVNRKSGLALFHLGNIYMLEGDRAKGIEAYNNAIANGYDDAQVFFTIGLVYEEEGNNDLALRNYIKAIHKDPTRPDARIRKIRMLIRAGEAQQALESIDEMLLACPDVFEGYHLRFLLLLEAGKLEDAESTIEGAMQIFPQDVGFAIDKAMLMVARKQYKEALAYLDQIEQTMDVDIVDQRSIAMQKAKIAADNGDMVKTIEALERAKQISLSLGKESLDCESTYMLVNCYIASEQFEKALENARLLKSVENINQFSVPAWYYEPYILKLMDKKQEAEPLYKESVEKFRRLSLENPGNLDFYVFRILCLRDTEQYEKALELCDYLVALQDEVAEVHAVKAVVLLAMGRKDEAAQEEKRAEELGGAVGQAIETIRNAQD